MNKPFLIATAAMLAITIAIGGFVTWHQGERVEITTSK